jgi:hypothetical protein
MWETLVIKVYGLHFNSEFVSKFVTELEIHDKPTKLSLHRYGQKAFKRLIQETYSRDLSNLSLESKRHRAGNCWHERSRRNS